MCVGKTYREEHDVGWLHGVLVGQAHQAVVDTAVELRLRRTPDREVPLERLVFKWLSIHKDLLLSLDVAVLFHDSTHGER